MSNRPRAALLLPLFCALLSGGAGAAPPDPPPTPPTTIPAPLVTICHVAEDGERIEPRTLRVASEAVPAHLKHGDSLGACPS